MKGDLEKGRTSEGGRGEDVNKAQPTGREGGKKTHTGGGVRQGEIQFIDTYQAGE